MIRTLQDRVKEAGIFFARPDLYRFPTIFNRPDIVNRANKVSHTNCVFCLSGKAINMGANCCNNCLAAMPQVLSACRLCASILEYSLVGETGESNVGHNCCNDSNGASASSITSINYHQDEHGYICPSCYTKPPPLDFVWSPYVYFTPLRRALHLMKFNQVIYYTIALGYLWQHAYNNPSSLNKPETIKYDLILPMPLHKKRQSERGFNQSTELIKPLARQLKIPISSGKDVLVIRNKSTQPQMMLPPQERIKNVRNAFILNKNSSHFGIKGKNILIVDDIITSGASSIELARLLKRNGANRVVAWSLLRA